MAEMAYQKRSAPSTREVVSQQRGGRVLEDNRAAYKQLKQKQSSEPLQRVKEEEELLQEKSAQPNRTGLPDNLKTGIESLSGISMDPVKVHYNSAQPAQLNALAYAQGSDIHVAPGQEKHLPHEAWHVVQQAQGRVKPTMQMKDGVPVNDDLGLEREADEMGNKAMQNTARPHSIPPSQMDTGNLLVPVQRKMGFEFETNYKFEIWKNNEWKAVGRTKGNPFYKGDGFAIEGDTLDNCEFILDPFAKKSEAMAAANAAYDLTKNVDKAFGDDGYAIYEKGGNWMRKTQIKDDKNNWGADAQVTQGVKLEDLPNYLQDHMNFDEQENHAEKMEDANIEAMNSKIKGFIELLIKFVMDFKGWDGINADEGPKNAQVWMARTKYSDMAKGLGKELAAFKSYFFKDEVWLKDNPITNATGVPGGTQVIPHRYMISETKSTGEPTTLKQWITQLCDESSEDDSMSPPQGWRGGSYGMGLMGMDETSGVDPLVLLEYRKTDNRDEMGEMSGKDVKSMFWADYVTEQFDKALKWNSTLSEN